MASHGLPGPPSIGPFSGRLVKIYHYYEPCSLFLFDKSHDPCSWILVKNSSHYILYGFIPKAEGCFLFLF